MIRIIIPFVICIIFIGILLISLYFIFEEDIFSEKAEEFMHLGKYSQAAKYYKLSSFIKDIFYIKLKKENDKDFYPVFECREMSIQAIVLYGDISQAINEYKKALQYVKKSLPHDEDMSKFLRLNLADCYSYLGYYKKSIPLYEELETWYPQNLIRAYLDTKEFSKAKSILDKKSVMEKIENGDDVDSIALEYDLFSYCKDTQQYEKASKNYSIYAPLFEISLIMPLNLADLYYRQNDFEKSKDMYEKILSTNDFSAKTKHKILINYAILLNDMNKNDDARKIFNLIFKEQKDLYKYSPEIICTNYYAGKILENTKYSNIAKDKFNNLHLKKDSYFYKDIDYFCKINNNY